MWHQLKLKWRGLPVWFPDYVMSDYVMDKALKMLQTHETYVHLQPNPRRFTVPTDSQVSYWKDENRVHHWIDLTQPFPVCDCEAGSHEQNCWHVAATAIELGLKTSKNLDKGILDA